MGINKKIDFSKSNFRLTLQKNFEELTIIPTLHRSTLSLIGMNLRENLKASRAIGDMLLALDDKNNLHTWDALSGKLIGSIFYSEFDFTKYIVHERSNFKA